MLEEWMHQVDDLGPAKILLTHDPFTKTRGILVVDNVAAGPSIGGIRMAPDVTVEEVCRLARAMTFKNAAAGLPHGGGKAGLIGDPAMPALEKERAVRAFARAIGGVDDYIPGPDMGTDERAMAWVKDEIGRSVGLPRVLGGIPLDVIGATGWGLAACADAAREFTGIELDGSRVAIQGFGAVGRHAARFLAERGARIVAVSDSRGGVENGDGLRVDALLAHKAEGESVRTFGGGRPIEGDALIDVDCEIWVPAARPDVLRADNCERLRARLVLSGANIPATPEAESRLHERGVLVLPDFIANAGGVICAAVEYHGGTQANAFEAIEEKIATNTRAVLARARDEKAAPRRAAEALARDRVFEAMDYRRAGLPASELAAPNLDM
jgi:glutamate dehydrogenase (NAD(P)+)